MSNKKFIYQDFINKSIKISEPSDGNYHISFIYQLINEPQVRLHISIDLKEHSSGRYTAYTSINRLNSGNEFKILSNFVDEINLSNLDLKSPNTILQKLFKKVRSTRSIKNIAGYANSLNQSIDTFSAKFYINNMNKGNKNFCGITTTTSTDDCPFITKFYNKSGYSFKITDGQADPTYGLEPPVGTIIDNGTDYDYCIANYWLINIYSDAGATGDYLGTASVSVQGSGDGQYLLDSNNLLIFTYNDSESDYPGSDCTQYRRAEDITAPSIASGPPAITNAWTSGMGNSDTSATGSASFWMQDYGMNEDGRWTASDNAIYQITKNINGNVGSRAYPVYLASGSPTWTINNCTPGSGSCSDNTVAPGVAFDGLWQIGIKFGSDGTGSDGFCETFYLAERNLGLSPGPSNYSDGAGSGGNYSREIDIVETRWKPTGPQSNCPTGGNTGWTTTFNSKQMGKWTDVGGIPTSDFITFGCLIRDNNCWIYAYKPDGTQWFSVNIPKNNSSYVQKGPFVPYIGTWSSGTSAGTFQTGYNNFVYLTQDDSKISGKNPVDDPDSFGLVLN